MKVLCVGDIHLADKPPSIRTETYAEDILAKLEHTVALAQARGVDRVVWAGDVFHIKTPSRTSHGLVQRVADVIAAYDCPVGIVPGNHDVTHDRLESLREQPLGVLFKAGAHMVDGLWEAGGPAGMGSEGYVFGIPWLQDWAKELPAYMDAWRRSEASLMVTHAPIVPPGDTRPFFTLDAEAWWAELMDRGGGVYYGHMHDPDGAYTVERDGETFAFCNFGAISRGSLHESTLKRKPTVGLWEDGTWEAIELPHRPAEAVFRLVEHTAEVDKQARLDEFLDGVERTEFAQISAEAIMAAWFARAGDRDVGLLLEDVLEVL